MFNDGGFMSDGGGFGGDDNQPKAGGKRAQNKRAQSLLPVTTRQIVMSNDESAVVVGGVEFTLVTVVGKVTQIETSSLKISYTIEDDRGSIEAVQWMEQGAEDEPSGVVENMYCRIHGSIRTQENKKILMVFCIKPIKSLNELTTHRLEVAVFAKKIELSRAKLLSGGTTSNEVGMNGGGGLGNSLMDMGYSKSSMAPMHRKVLEVIKGFQDPGVHVNDINSHLKEKISQAQINKICEDLMNEGHIYSSIDDSHFLSTEN